MSLLLHDSQYHRQKGLEVSHHCPKAYQSHQGLVLFVLDTMSAYVQGTRRIVLDLMRKVRC
jgi:hypothetical protein